MAEINDYLSKLYYAESPAYRYVESCMKMFYLISRHVYSRIYLDVESYNNICQNKDIKTRMPRKKKERSLFRYASILNFDISVLY